MPVFIASVTPTPDPAVILSKGTGAAAANTARIRERKLIERSRALCRYGRVFNCGGPAALEA